MQGQIKGHTKGVWGKLEGISFVRGDRMILILL